MKYIFGFLFILTLGREANAAQFSLDRVEQSAYEANVEKIRTEIAVDDTRQVPFPFDRNQSFSLKDQNQLQLGYLIPVKFNSKSYKNTICRLYFLNLHNNLTSAELFAERNHDDDIVSSCIGVEAVSIQDKAADEALYLAVVRYRTVNRYGSRAAVLTYKSGALFYDDKTTICVNVKGEIASIKSLKKRLLSCM